MIKLMRSLFIAISVLALLCGCAADTHRLPRVTATELDRVLNGSSLSQDYMESAPVPDEDIFGLSGDMREFIVTSVSGLYGDDAKIRALLKALLSPDGLELKFDEKATFTAREVFHHRKANCLSFTIMMVAMLRYLGMDVAFNQVEVPPIWDLRQNLLILSQHVNAMVTKSDGRREVLDINMEEFELHYPQKIIDDQTAAAMFYNNLSMELMLTAGATPQAHRFMRKALDLDQDLPYIWTNLGTIYRNQGRLAEAEIAYRLALEREPFNLVAISKAEQNYTDLGDKQMAGYFSQRALSYRLKNPYYRYTLARDELLKGDYAGALANIRVAINRYNKEHRFFFLQGVIYTALAEREHADASFKKALELSSSQLQQDDYRRKIDKLI